MKKGLFFFIFTLTNLVNGQTDTSYSIIAEIGGGYARYFTTTTFDALNKNGFDAVLRVMWVPEHILSVGLETGYKVLYTIDESFQSDEFGTTNLNIELTSIPVSALFSMKVLPVTLPELRLNGGSGIAVLFNKVKFYGSLTNNSQISIYYTVGLNYVKQLSRNLSLGGEVKFSHYSKIEDSNISLLLLLGYNLLNW